NPFQVARTQPSALRTQNSELRSQDHTYGLPRHTLYVRRYLPGGDRRQDSIGSHDHGGSKQEACVGFHRCSVESCPRGGAWNCCGGASHHRPPPCLEKKSRRCRFHTSGSVDAPWQVIDAPKALNEEHRFLLSGLVAVFALNAAPG